jgi:hypothetical protein
MQQYTTKSCSKQTKNIHKTNSPDKATNEPSTLYSSVQQRAPEPNTNGSTKYTLLHSHGVVPVHQDAVGLGQVLLVAAALKISVGGPPRRRGLCPPPALHPSLRRVRICAMTAARVLVVLHGPRPMAA